ncbi:hypothetical protein [Methylobacterium sp. R2-1]|uniref:hypothetical protein n=1 Tax=Methylobacterium sp. R2-1 TaxID=2587064 RepID=UPI00161393BF|nr:hypothetical protein [Methylobacterium sp. R2-1]MBB2964065.1 hypothetical protein [Methylobacterium sp. R2-1]
MTHDLFNFSYLRRKQLCWLFELSANHFVCTPNDFTDFDSHVGSTQHKGIWDGISIKQRHLDATARNIMDETTCRGVLVQRDRSFFVQETARLRPAVFNVIHLSAFRIDSQSQGRRNNARTQSLKLIASLPSCEAETKRCAAVIAQAEQGVSHGA